MEIVGSLSGDRVFRSAKEGFDPQMLLDPPEQLDN
jgi:hypothetical protein